MVELPADESSDGTERSEGGYMEHEVYLSASDTATFLRELADQIEDGDELTIRGENWSVPFQFGEPIEVELEVNPERELEIELELDWNAGGEGLSVE